MAESHRVLFVGSKRLGLRILKVMHQLAPQSLLGVLTIDDQADTRTAYADFREFASQASLPLHVAANRKESEQILQQIRPDLCIVVGWYWLLSEAALAASSRGYIGIHNSLLPRHRGAAPLIWPIINGEEEVGFSLFSFTAGMDDGPVWAQGRVRVEPDDYIGDVLAKLEDSAVKLMGEIYLPLLRGEIQPVEQAHELATYCAQRLPSDGLVNWHQPASSVYNFIRAQSDPYPGAYTFLGKSEMKIWRARLFDKPYCGTSGQVAQIDPQGVHVICGDHRALILQEVELDGRRQPASHVINTIKLRLPSTNPTYG